jgi:energy-coupling factor transport system permease protein
VFLTLYVGLLLWARLLRAAARQIWRLKWLMLALFVVDWLFIGVDLAVIILMRLTILVSVFTLFVGTTTPEELRLALERIGVPYRYAFSLSLAFQSVTLLHGEWRAIQEAQRARGVWKGDLWRVRTLVQNLGRLVALTVPAIVLTTRRAWAMTEAAYARGFEAPHRRPYRVLRMRWSDWCLIAAIVVTVGSLWLV